jgi:hypothetical protein
VGDDEGVLLYEAALEDVNAPIPVAHLLQAGHSVAKRLQVRFARLK